MLNQLDIDKLQLKIQNGETPELYYVAHAIEPREGEIDEVQYKSVSRFRAIKIKISEISNAYFEYLNFVNNPNNYHEESEESYYDRFTKYIHYYTVPNYTRKDSDNNIVSRMPSIVYGRRKHVIIDGTVTEINEPSPVKPIFVNVLEYADFRGTDIQAMYNANKLNWKYMHLNKPELVDGVQFNYVTSDWYILKCINFPRIEHILINTKLKSSYFTNLNDAFDFINQLEA